MSFGTIYHNTSAVNALRNLQSTDRQMTTSFARLASGLRINRAADDVAGLAVSEKMRAQISGINQSKQNSQDGISMIQTAEGVLDTAHAVLQRMRALAVEAANDSYTSYDRTQIQNEINQLVEELERVAQYTEFNTMKLLNGNCLGKANVNNLFSAQAEVVGKVENADYSVTILDAGTACNIHGTSNLTDGEDPDTLLTLKDIGIIDRQELHIYSAGVATIIEVYADDSLTDLVNRINKSRAGVVAGLDSEGNDLTLTALHSGSRFNISFGDDPDGIATKLGLCYGTKNDLSSPRFAQDLAGNNLTHKTFTSGTDTIISITNITLQSMFPTEPGSPSRPGGYGQSLGVFRSDCDIFTEKELMNPINSLDPADTLRPLWPSVNGVSDKVNLTESLLLKGIVLYIDEQIDYGVMQQTNDDDSEGDWTAYYPDPNATPAGDAGSNGETDHRARVPEEMELAYANYYTLTSFKLSIRDSRPVYHIGPNEDQTINVDFGNIRPEVLGLTVNLRSSGNFYNGKDVLLTGAKAPDFRLNISLQTQQCAEAAITTIDNAIKTVSAYRSRLGSYQQALNHSVHYLEVADENMTSAESRIRDVDMAEEITNLTRHQILIQSGTAMLAQANARHQMVLQLLQ
ncbi:MAG: flagellin [Candidatus Wallbacteria bacterium]|nr:flagellin [Candidatus Wallbacteria bacterium]